MDMVPKGRVCIRSASTSMGIPYSYPPWFRHSPCMPLSAGQMPHSHPRGQVSP